MGVNMLWEYQDEFSFFSKSHIMVVILSCTAEVCLPVFSNFVSLKPRFYYPRLRHQSNLTPAGDSNGGRLLETMRFRNTGAS